MWGLSRRNGGTLLGMGLVGSPHHLCLLCGVTTLAGSCFLGHKGAKAVLYLQILGFFGEKSGGLVPLPHTEGPSVAAHSNPAQEEPKPSILTPGQQLELESLSLIFPATTHELRTRLGLCVLLFGTPPCPTKPRGIHPIPVPAPCTTLPGPFPSPSSPWVKSELLFQRGACDLSL